MQDGQDRLYKLGGISFIASGALFLAKSVLEWLIGPPPAIGVEILEWRDAHAVLLGSVSEVFFFALTLLVPAVIALYASLARTHRGSAALGCGVLALTIPILGVVLAVHGRLVYPVHHIRVHTPEIAEFVVAVYYGGLHVVALLFAGATFVLSLSMRRGAYGGNLARLGFATAALDLAAGYPEIIGPTLWLVCGACFAAWFVGLGVKIYGMPAAPQSLALDSVPGGAPIDERICHQ